MFPMLRRIAMLGLAAAVVACDKSERLDPTEFPPHTYTAEEIAREWRAFGPDGDYLMSLAQGRPICVRGSARYARFEYFIGEDSMIGRYRTSVAGEEVDVRFTYDRWFDSDALTHREPDPGASAPDRPVSHAEFFRGPEYAGLDPQNGYIAERVDLSAAGGEWVQRSAEWSTDRRPLKAYFRYRPGDEASRRVARAFAQTIQGCPPPSP
jgi:hypothetical protein